MVYRDDLGRRTAAPGFGAMRFEDLGAAAG